MFNEKISASIKSFKTMSPKSSIQVDVSEGAQGIKISAVIAIDNDCVTAAVSKYVTYTALASDAEIVDRLSYAALEEALTMTGIDLDTPSYSVDSSRDEPCESVSLAGEATDSAAYLDNADIVEETKTHAAEDFSDPSIAEPAATESTKVEYPRKKRSPRRKNTAKAEAPQAPDTVSQPETASDIDCDSQVEPVAVESVIIAGENLTSEFSSPQEEETVLESEPCIDGSETSVEIFDDDGPCEVISFTKLERSYSAGAVTATLETLDCDVETSVGGSSLCKDFPELEDALNVSLTFLNIKKAEKMGFLKFRNQTLGEIYEKAPAMLKQISWLGKITTKDPAFSQEVIEAAALICDTVARHSCVR